MAATLWAGDLVSVAAEVDFSAAPASGRFRVELPTAVAPTALLSNSPFGINTAFRPDSPELEARLEALQKAGIKWGRQDFTWKRIEQKAGEYDFAPYDRLVEQCHAHGLLLFGNLTSNPEFYDMRTPGGVGAYRAFASAAVKRYAGKVDYWQIWNEPNLGYLSGAPEHYAALLKAAGPAIHHANPNAKVLAFNMAFCDVLWAEKILSRVPYDCFDIVCFHPYRPPNAPEEKFDWWVLDQYVKRFHKSDLTPDYPLGHATYLEQVTALREALAKYGKPKPLWVTEICWNTHIHPYGTSELRQADLAVRFHLLSLASQQVEKVFWWTLKDVGTRQFDQADMVGLMRQNLEPKYAYYAYGWMTRMLEGRRWLRNDAFGPEVFACVFTDDTKAEDIIVAWSTKPFAYIKVPVPESGLHQFDVFGTRRRVDYDPVRTKHNTFPLGESPIYVVGPKGMKATVRPDPGW